MRIEFVRDAAGTVVEARVSQRGTVRNATRQQ
jgi:hypothetical protein